MKIFLGFLTAFFIIGSSYSVAEDGVQELLKKAETLLKNYEKCYQMYTKFRNEMTRLQNKANEYKEQNNPKLYKEFLEYSNQKQRNCQELQKYMQSYHKESLDLLNSVIKQDSKSAKAYILMASWATYEDKNKAIEYLSKAIEIEPKNAQIFLNRGALYYAKQCYREALRDFKFCAEQNYNTEYCHSQMAKCNFVLEQWAECQANLEFCIAKKYCLEESYFLKARISFNQQKFQDVLATVELLLKMDTLPANTRQIVCRLQEDATRYRDFYKEESQLEEQERKVGDLPVVKMVTIKGAIVFELFENQAPNTVANFLSLVEKNFYDGTRFHKIIPNLAVQGGDPNTKDSDPSNDGAGGPGYFVKDEIGVNSRKHFRGFLSMANSEPNKNGSQFFITKAPTPWLDAKHTVFGMIVSGMEVLDCLEKGDILEKVEILRKRTHVYKPEIIPYSSSKKE